MITFNRVRNTLVCLLVFLFKSQFILSNPLFFEEYDWESSALYEEVDAAGHSAIFLKDLKSVEYYYDASYSTLLQLYTVHNKILVNTHESVEIYNKHYIPTSRVLEIEDLRVRVITPEQVLDIDEIDLKDFQGEDNYSSYKFFAIDGVEVGSQIEFIYTLKMLPQLEGSREYFQSDVLKLNNEFHIFCEDKMFFRTKSYNGLASAVLDTSVSGKNHYIIAMESIGSLKPELYAPYHNSLMRVEYKVDYISPANEVKLYTYDQLANQLNAYLKEDMTAKETKALKKFSSKLKLDGLTELEKITRIENYVKRSISISETGGQGKEGIITIIDNHVANQRGIMKLFIALFELNNLEYFYGLTSDRSRVAMDPDFESYSWLENYIFYFPQVDKYMAPTETLYRLGYIPYNWSNNHGLFIKNLRLGSTNSAIGFLRFIEPLPYDDNEDILDIKIEVQGDFDALNLHVGRIFTGYNVTYIQPVFELIPEKERKMLLNELLNFSGQDVDLLNYRIENASLDNYYLKPLVIKGTATTDNSFFDRAGNRYLLKVGELIGEQVEMYQKEERMLPVENEYNRNYNRRIEITIPDGYRIANLEDMKVNLAHFELDGEETMGFHSDFEIEDNKLTMVIKEYYKQLTYPIDQFEDFRSIINAAADFNKKVLIFEKI